MRKGPTCGTGTVYPSEFTPRLFYSIFRFMCCALQIIVLVLQSFVWLSYCLSFFGLLLLITQLLSLTFLTFMQKSMYGLAMFNIAQQSLVQRLPRQTTIVQRRGVEINTRQNLQLLFQLIFQILKSTDLFNVLY